jgi:hypothetical protein
MHPTIVKLNLPEDPLMSLKIDNAFKDTEEAHGNIMPSIPEVLKQGPPEHLLKTCHKLLGVQVPE